MKTTKRTRALALLSAILSFMSIGRAADPAAAAPKSSAEHAPAARSFKNIGVAEFEKLRRDTNNVVLDVRTPKEYVAGHMPGAINIDVNGPDFEKRVATLDPKKTYLVHCAAGVRSARACGKMSQLKFDQLYNLEGGFRAWEKAGNKPQK